MDLQDKDMLNDALASQKYIIHSYSSTIEETDNDTLCSQLIDLYKDEHDIRLKVFQAMNQMGWYQPQLIDNNQLNTARNKFANVQSQIAGARTAGPQPGAIRI